MAAGRVVAFRVLGPLEATVDGEVIRLGGAKQRTVLAMLLLHANHVVSADLLIEAVWGDAATPRAVNTLQVYVSTLRALLDRRDASPSERMIVTRPPGYLMRLGTEQLDLLQFEELTGTGRRLVEETDYAAASEQLHAALSLWRGPAFADLVDVAHISDAARDLEERRLAALEARIDADLALGRHAELIPELERLTTQQPLREHLRGQLMLALARSGRQADALDAYRATRAMLADELGIDPGPHLQELHQAVLAQDERVRAERGAHSVLLYLDGAGIQRTVTMAAARSTYTVGRLPENDLPLPWDAQVSRFHARLTWVGERWVLEDTSRNGSFVNGVRVDRTCPLSDGDVLRFGRTAVTYRAPSTGRRFADTEYAGETALPAPLQRAVHLDATERRVLEALVTIARTGGCRDETALSAAVTADVGGDPAGVGTAMASVFRQFAVDNLPLPERLERLVDRASIVGLAGPSVEDAH